MNKIIKQILTHINSKNNLSPEVDKHIKPLQNYQQAISPTLTTVRSETHLHQAIPQTERPVHKHDSTRIRSS